MKDGKAPAFLAHVKIDEWERPRIGTQLRLPGSSKMWQVIRADPSDNPTGQKVTYFVEEVS